MAPIPTANDACLELPFARDLNKTNIIDYCAKCDDFEETKDLTEIQKFYDKKNVLITGATGFLGKILVEKLLRCCPGLENLYLLVRQKRGKDIYTRVEEIFDDPVFNKLKDEFPKFRHKVVVMSFDCVAAGLGLSITDRQTLIEKVNIVFHSAATVKFDEHLRTALATNVKAPLALQQLAKDMKRLDVFMHVSTAYSNSHLSAVDEKFYDCPVNSEQLQKVIDKMTDAEIDRHTNKILGAWPNTYTFTKAMAENELKYNAGGMPLGIFRPAIVTSTAKEPLECWVDNMYGPTGVAVGSVTGILRTVQVDESVTAAIVPVDYVVNCLMVAARTVHNTYAQTPPPLEPPIYNYVSAAENRLTWGDFRARNLNTIDRHPLSNAVWYISITMTRSAILHNIYLVFLHLLPAVLVDGLSLCIGRKPKMLKVYKKIHKFSSVLSYFTTKEIQFTNKRVEHLWDSTSDSDKKEDNVVSVQRVSWPRTLRYPPVEGHRLWLKLSRNQFIPDHLFPFNMKEIDWDNYFDNYLIGIRRYLFKESDATIPRARIKWKRLYYLHQIVKFIFYLSLSYLLLTILIKIFS